MARPQTVSDDEILDTALNCLLEQGPSVSMDVIARRLGVSSQALLKRFHSRKKLVIAALRLPEKLPWHCLVEAGPDDRPVRAQLNDIVRAVAEFLIDVVRRMAVLRWSGIDPRDMLETYVEPPPLVDLRILSEWFRRAADRGLIRQGNHRATALILLSALHTPAMLEEIMGKHPIDDGEQGFHRQLVTVLLDGIG